MPKIKRLELYNQVYTKVHHLYDIGKPQIDCIHDLPKVRKSKLFAKEIKDHSVLEIGCGSGLFLLTLFKMGIAKNLTGLDVTIPNKRVRDEYPEINFLQSDITEFHVENGFDVIYSNHVFEHISPLDVDTHLQSIHKALNNGGCLILNIPNRLFGPSDITRIIDFSGTGITPAIGTHLNETTYIDIINVLSKHGFTNFKTTFPNVYLRHLLPDFRMSPNFMLKIEGSKKLLSLLHKIKINNKCLFSLEVTIICNKE